MLVGAVIGAIGNGAGVVIGGIVGIILGALVGNKLKQGRVADTRIASLEDGVKQLNERMKAFEGGAVNAPAVASPSTTLSVLPPVPDVRAGNSGCSVRALTGVLTRAGTVRTHGTRAGSDQAATAKGTLRAVEFFLWRQHAGARGYIAWFKAWRELNLVGFAFTALIGFAWGAGRYRPEFFATTEPFLILFFLMYVAITVLFALRQAPKLTHYVDGTIVFGVPLVAFGMQAAMMKETEFGAAISALAVAALYLILATVLHAKKRDSLRLLVESFLALGVGFATLAVPLALDARWTSAVWAVEGAAIVWVGVRQNRLLARAFGMFLQLAAGLAFLSKFNRMAEPEHLLPLLNANYLGCVMVSVAALFINCYAERRRDVVGENERLVTRALFVWGALWWLAGGVLEIERHVGGRAEWNAELIFFAGSCAGFAALWHCLNWNMARFAALAVLPLTAIILWGMATNNVSHPFEYHGYAGWIIAFIVHITVLRMHTARDGGNLPPLTPSLRSPDPSASLQVFPCPGGRREIRPPRSREEMYGWSSGTQPAFGCWQL